MKEQCYFCGKEATTREHVPPKCLFPEMKDSGDDYRVNLITVPSCDEHNLHKSQDDEFLMASIAPGIHSNKIGILHTHTKVARAATRRKKLSDEVLLDAITLEIPLPNNRVYPVRVGKADAERIYRTFECIARGLYYHTFGKRFAGEVAIMPMFAKNSNPNIEKLKLVTEIMYLGEGYNWNEVGVNKKVFYYKYGPLDQFGCRAMRMTFYEGAHVFIAFKPDGSYFPFRRLDEATPENPIVITLEIQDENGQ